MALILPSRTDVIKVIVRADSALKWPESSDEADEMWATYLKTNDESGLSFKDGQQPTRFVLRKVLNFDQFNKVQNEQMVMKNGQMQVQLSFISEAVRQALVAIENPEMTPLADQIVFKKENDGGASKDLIAGLNAIKATMDLYTAVENSTAKFTDDLKKK